MQRTWWILADPQKHWGGGKTRSLAVWLKISLPLKTEARLDSEYMKSLVAILTKRWKVSEFLPPIMYYITSGFQVHSLLQPSARFIDRDLRSLSLRSNYLSIVQVIFSHRTAPMPLKSEGLQWAGKGTARKPFMYMLNSSCPTFRVPHAKRTPTKTKKEITWMWSRTERAEFSEMPRSADGPPQMIPTLRGLCSFASGKFSLPPSDLLQPIIPTLTSDSWARAARLDEQRPWETTCHSAEPEGATNRTLPRRVLLEVLQWAPKRPIEWHSSGEAPKRDAMRRRSVQSWG